ncbi:unnamed protein product [Adineta steineri]|uniref:Uncharacterized protein n=1 Tax=Adineta steineri TaxID=433720 RepID=A0A819Y4P2_9BILA|nr:unnamed protein product [Adineta steineri]
MTVNSKNCSSFYDQKTCSLGTSVWCCLAISYVECGAKVDVCDYRPIPTIPTMIFHFTKPYFPIKPVIEKSILPHGLEIFLYIVAACSLYIPLLFLIGYTCWRCFRGVSTIFRNNQRHTKGQSKVNVSTQNDKELSVSTISILFEALPPSYNIATDNHIPQVLLPSYDIAITHLQSVNKQSQLTTTTTATGDLILRV